MRSTISVRTRFLVAGMLASLALLVSSTLALSSALASTPSGASAARSCMAPTEDSPGWDWTVCGNHKRGIVTVNGTPRVVGPCMFRRLLQDLQVDYRPTDVLRGDRWAYLHGCDRIGHAAHGHTR